MSQATLSVAWPANSKKTPGRPMFSRALSGGRDRHRTALGNARASAHFNVVIGTLVSGTGVRVRRGQRGRGLSAIGRRDA